MYSTSLEQACHRLQNEELAHTCPNPGVRLIFGQNDQKPKWPKLLSKCFKHCWGYINYTWPIIWPKGCYNKKVNNQNLFLPFLCFRVFNLHSSLLIIGVRPEILKIKCPEAKKWQSKSLVICIFAVTPFSFWRWMHIYGNHKFVMLWHCALYTSWHYIPQGCIWRRKVREWDETPDQLLGFEDNLQIVLS